MFYLHFNYYRSAANRKHAPALYNLGLCYEMGLGVKPDEKMVSSKHQEFVDVDGN